MLPLIIAPQDILRAKAESLPLPLSKSDLLLAQAMEAAVVHYNGIGLAAPQVNFSRRLIVISTGEKPQAYFNPEIVKSSWRKVVMEEGCLSLPGVYGLVKRPIRVLANYLGSDGLKHQEWLDGLTARVYQHEVDHLNGILFIDLTKEIIAGQELLAKYKNE
ncbi:peptide deformylase [Patescibacteria group bacterium]|nr:peptide deformylase [Patescibacteria group bacterium]